MTPAEINSIIQIPSEDLSSPVKTSEAEFIYNFIKENNIKRTLETGFAYAKSASHIIAASGSNHIACDPFQKNYQNLGLSNIEKLGMKDKLEFHCEYSHNLLPQLLKDNKNKFEFIFIDGDHKFDGELIDFYYADLLLENEGYVLLHDTWMRSTSLLMQFIKTNRKDYKKIPTGLRNLALYQKVGKDSRNGMFFREFYTLNSLLSHNIILYITTGKQNMFKKLLVKIKNRLK
jgi:predicted O-methyltransferase YrrM